jgi:lipoprotein-anchoring transpeptidase ErfK/SrfK
VRLSPRRRPVRPAAAGIAAARSGDSPPIGNDLTQIFRAFFEPLEGLRRHKGRNPGVVMFSIPALRSVTLAALAGAVLSTAAAANPMSLFAPSYPARDPQPVLTEPQDETQQAARFQRQVVSYPTNEAAGTVIIDTPNTYLYLVLGNGRALRYGIGVGREGFTWSGVQTVTKKAEWPDWTPPPEMLERQPYLPRFMAGGPGNPLGARAMYLGGTVYRIHGTTQPETIGTRVSSGCIRMVNEDVIDLYSRINVGTKVVVLPTDHRADAHRVSLVR